MKQKSNPSLAQDVRMIAGLLLRGRFSALLLQPTDNGVLKFFRYCLVGGLATIVDWGALYGAEALGLHYLAAAVVGFLAGLTCKYFLSKFMVFQAETAKLDPRREFLAYGAIGVVGLILTMILMYVMTECFCLYFMISKVIATALVLMWNFLARKYLLY